MPLRPPVPPQRHDCPQLRGMRLPAAAAAGDGPQRRRRGGGKVAYGGKGTCRGVFARSGWRVNAGNL
ncbi:hypothetical protein GCM10023257_23910 [Streptomyces hyderabadensis]|uniref:Uncharacterized protein n=1 Tax=Streptomyces hyderabadensis TaxID=598549 RepID=A0ABP9I0H6_9ACTN